MLRDRPTIYPAHLEITLEMVEGGLAALSAHDEGVEPREVLILRVLGGAFEKSNPGTSVALAPEVAAAFARYLGSQVDT